MNYHSFSKVSMIVPWSSQFAFTQISSIIISKGIYSNKFSATWPLPKKNGFMLLAAITVEM